MGVREQAARLAQVNAHYVSDVAWIRKHGSPEMLERVRDGSLGLQDALRALGRVTQRDRYRARIKQTLDLCEAVLDGDYRKAEILASQIIVQRVAPHSGRKKTKTDV